MNSTSSNAPNQAKLPVHEWTAVAFIITLLFTLAALACFNGDSNLSEKLDHPHHIVDAKVEVFVEGAVEKSGAHLVKRGSQIKDVLALALPSEEADLRKLNVNKKVKEGQIIKVPQLNKITVFIQGAINSPQTLTLPKGARLQEIIPHLEFQENADIQKLKRKRLLKDAETIDVKYKSQKSRSST